MRWDEGVVKFVKHKWKMVSIILISVISFSLPVYTEAGEDEETETVLFENFNTMDYALFLSTDVGYGLSLDYYRYGIFGDMTESVRDGEILYFKLNEILTGNSPASTEHMEWAENAVKEHIVDVSPDLKWIITRQCRERSEHSGMEKVYVDKAFSEEGWFEWGECLWGYSIRRLAESGEYALIKSGKMKEAKNTVENFWQHPVNAKSNFYVCFDENAELFAVPGEKGNHIINIYGTDGWTLLHSLELTDGSTDCPIEVSQISGNKEAGWLVFSCGDTTYRMTYPDGKTEKIGEFMYGTTYSPDGKYIAYCTGNFALYDMWEYWNGDEKKTDAYFELRSRWDAIPPGWYVEELETGNVTYIPVEVWTYDVERPLYGGRCVWLEKDKLQEILGL